LFAFLVCQNMGLRGQEWTCALLWRSRPYESAMAIGRGTLQTTYWDVGQAKQVGCEGSKILVRKHME
jgi:hypothetical protein